MALLSEFNEVRDVNEVFMFVTENILFVSPLNIPRDNIVE